MTGEETVTRGVLIPASADELIARLRQHRIMGAAPQAELEWLAAHGELHRFNPEDAPTMSGYGQQGMLIVLTGRVEFLAGPMKKRIIEWRTGDVTGVLPYSRMTASPGEAVARETTDVLEVQRSLFPELMRECPFVTTACVHVMLDRARIFNTSDLHDEKMASLGRLSAGLAHELNNPASAASRSASRLAADLEEAEQAAIDLGAAGLTAAERAAVDHLRQACIEPPAASANTLSPLERADREEELSDWLQAHEANASASVLADSQVTVGDLDGLAKALRPAVVAPAVRAIVANLGTRALALEIEKAATRMHQLVMAVKGFTYMDRAPSPEPIDVARGLRDTLAVHASKARERGITVQAEFEPDMPPLNAYGGELNQIWSNLLDNALDAARSRVQVSASHHAATVTVRFIDDGPGIPDHVRPRIFDTFFTTKPVGQGTGLGLDIVRRLTRRHDGNVEVESAPGRTEFRVTLPVRSTPPNVPPPPDPRPHAESAHA